MGETRLSLRDDLLLYAVTDRSWLGDGDFYEQLEEILKAGVTMVQLREKSLGYEAFREEAMRALPLCRQYGVPLIINDNVALAKEVGADGVHVGQSDMEIERAKALLGPDKLVGGSAHNVEEALAAERAGADYLGCGAIFGSATKTDAGKLALSTLKEICSAVSIPVVAIGGIEEANLGSLAGTGIAGAAVVSAIFAQEDKAAAVKRLLRLARKAAL